MEKDSCQEHVAVLVSAAARLTFLIYIVMLLNVRILFEGERYIWNRMELHQKIL